MDTELKKLINLTTIVQVYNNLKSRKIIFGDKDYSSRFNTNINTDKQINLNILENNWKNKFISFGNKWDKERQNYRFLRDSFELFYYSFKQLHFNKVACINENSDNQREKLYFNSFAGANLYGMYYHGKKCIDLLEKLNLFDKQNYDLNYIEKFRETRNKLIEHNYNPFGLKLQIDPSIWRLASNTHSLLEIYIHKNNSERAYDATVDYYEDYYRLENIITNIIKRF